MQSRRFFLVSIGIFLLFAFLFEGFVPRTVEARRLKRRAFFVVPSVVVRFPQTQFPQSRFSQPVDYSTATPSRIEYEVGPKTSLFNGTDLSGWTNADGDEPPKGWSVEDGQIVRKENGGDLYSEKKYENFVLEFEFKISEKGNSGVKYRSWNPSGYGLGYEYQIFDDINVPDNPPKYRTASLYDVYVPETDASLLKLGEFNQGKIVVMGNYIEHWLNGQRTCWALIGSSDWKEKVGKSKFAETKEYGTTELGRVLLQDHGSLVWFRNISISELKPFAVY